MSKQFPGHARPPAGLGLAAGVETNESGERALLRSWDKDFRGRVGIRVNISPGIWSISVMSL